MEKHKKKVLILIGVILAFIALIAILLGIIFKDENKDKPSTNNGSTNNNISKTIEELVDDNIFFSLQNVINDYYTMIKNEDTNNLLKILDSDYIKMNNINTNNIYSKLPANLQSTSFVLKSAYYNPNSSITYYFMNGYFTNASILDDDDFSEYLPSINYLITVNNKGNYVIRPLENNIDLKSYANNFDIRDKTIDSNNIFRMNNTSEKNKLSIYLNEFLNLMFYDNERAYNMLDDSMKNKYNGRADFQNQLMDIYNKFSTTIFGFSVKEVNGENIYSIIDDKQNKITIYEKNTMNYKISY